MREAMGCAFRIARTAGMVVALLMGIGTASRPGFAQPLVLRHPWPDAHATLQRLAADFARQGGTPVRVLYDPKAPSASAWLPAGTDIAGLRRFGATEPAIGALARARRIQDLTPWMDIPWRSGFIPAMLQPFALRSHNRWGAPPGIYGVPLSSFAQLFIYRPDAFTRAGVAGNPQKWRWEQFLSAGVRLRRIGVEPLVGAFHERGHPALAQMYEQAHLGTSGLFATYRLEVPYRSVNWRALFRQYVSLRQAGICTSDLALAPRPQAESAFLQGRAAMLVDGPWFAGVQARLAPKLTGWRVFSPPSGAWGARFLPAAPGGIGDSLVINARGRRQRLAAAFLRWLTLRTDAQVAYANATWMLPASWNASKSRTLNPRLRAFAYHIGGAATDPAIFEDPAVKRILYDGVVAVLRGRSDMETVLAEADRAKTRRR